jgi:predicted hydrocarbon binding protein
MNLLGALGCSMEESLGRPANSMAYVAGKKLGREFSQGASKTTEIEPALAEVRRVLQANNCMWAFETFKPSKRANLIEKAEGSDEVMLVFRDCMIRQALFRFGHHQKGSLCNMMYGFFAGALESIMDRKATLEILHAGENACYKRLLVE